MSPTAIFWPMIAHAALVFAVYVVLGLRRRDAVMSGAARAGQFKTRGVEPDGSATAAANLMNQFELPVLFHVVGLALFATNGVSYVAVVLAWLFVLLRYVHTGVHVTSNNLRVRSAVFAAGFVVLILMWIWFALHLAGVA